MYPPYLKAPTPAVPEIAAAKQQMQTEGPFVLVAMLLLAAVAFVGLAIKV